MSVTSGSGFADGAYSLKLYVEGDVLAEGSIEVGGTITGPQITGLVFSDGVTAGDEPTNPSYLLPSGITSIYAFFDYTGMEDGADWARAWHSDGQQIHFADDVWDEGGAGSTHVDITSADPLVPGVYRLEIYVEDALLAVSNFAIAGTQTDEAIGPVTFAEGVNAQGNPINAGTVFDTGLLELHLFFDFAGMQNGMDFDETWLLDGEELVTFEMAWQDGPSGTFHDYIYRTSGEALPDGVYTLELYVQGQLARTATTTVGTGVSPPDPTPVPDGLYIQGFVLDADTGVGIAGALYIAFVPGVTLDTWNGSEEQIYAAAETDATGYFELGLPLERGQSYSILVLAEGYRLAQADDVLIGDDPSPVEVEITLQKE
ncbi:MAG: carboxypeptidase regulatory-like domain-containing protein [Anaerolineales bacterium]|nr:MAG: carboxypeptidase regulatory-like domain-containing protein [Anaerolineales bacterium]